MSANIIPYGRQQIDAEDIAAVVDVLNSDFLTQGSKIYEFESAFADYIGTKYAIAVANGTAALHLSAMAMNVGPGDKVITTPITFAASANCIAYCGGTVVFADIDPETYLISLESVRKLLESSPKGTYSGIIPVDFAGRPVQMDKLREIVDEYNLWIIEDACHAPGGVYADKSGVENFCGNGNYSELAIFSFHPVKHIATGEGGMITTNDRKLYERLLELRTHGITKDPTKYKLSPQFASGLENNMEFPGWYMELQELGYNYRLTDFQSALGITQLKKAAEGLNKRRELARVYNQAFKNARFLEGQSGEIMGHAYHLYVLEVEDRLGLYNYLRDHNIYTQVHYIPCHLMPYYRQFGWKEGDLPNAEKYYKHCLSIPMYPTLTKDQQNKVINRIFEFYETK